MANRPQGNYGQQREVLTQQRTGFAPSLVRYANLAPQDVTEWSAAAGTATITTGISAPDSTTDAASLSTVAPPTNYRRIYDTERTIAVGDWLIAGVWVKASALSQGASQLPGTMQGYAAAALRVIDDTEGYGFDLDGLNYRELTATDTADTRWEWIATNVKIESAPSGNTANVVLDLNCDDEHAVSFYAPLLWHVPADELTDDDIDDLMRGLYSVPDGAEAGIVATLKGQSFQSKIRDAGGQVFNIKAFGAIGDAETNDTGAVRLAVAAANPGDTIHLPDGVFRLTEQLVIDQRINIKGEGAGSILFLDLDTSTDGVVIDGSGGAGTYTDNISYRDFAVLGGASACRNAVVFRNVTHADVSNVHVAAGTASTGYGVVIEGCLISTWQLTVNSFMNYPYTATAPSNGILVIGSALNPSNANLFLYPAVAINNTSGESFFIDGSTGVTGTTNNWILGGNIEGGALNGLHLKNNNYFSIQSIHLENTSGSGDFNRVRTIIENCSHGYIGPGVGMTGVQLINTADTTIDGIIADDVVIDEDCERIRVGRIQYNVTGLGGFHDSGVNTTYMGDLQVPGVTSSFLTGRGATGSQTNLVRNGGAEFWNGGTCIDWGTESAGLTKTGTGLGDTRKLFGDYAVKTTSGTQYVFVSLRSPEIEMVAGRTITASVWVYVPSGQATPPELSLELWIDGGAGVLGGQATDVEDEWVQLCTTFYVPDSATALQVTVHNSATAGAGYFYVDGVSAVFGRTAPYAEATRLPHALGLTLNNGTYKTNFRPSSSQAADINYTLPPTDGGSGQALIADGSGGLDWGTVATLSGTTNYYPLFNSSTTITTSGSLLQNFSGSLIVGGHILFTDNTHDIGVSSDNRPRNVYVATALTTPRMYLGGGGPSVIGGSGDPEGAETAEPGSIYLRTNGTWYKKDSGSGNTGWALQGSGGSGDVVGPGSATDNALARFDSTTGKLIQNSGLTLSDLTTNTYTQAVVAPTVAGTSTAGIHFVSRASDAVAGNVTNGAAAGGDNSVIAGDAKRLNTGDANGGNVYLTQGAGIGSGTDGQIVIGRNGTGAVPAIAWAGALNSGISNFSSGIQFTYAGSNNAAITANGLKNSSNGRVAWSSDTTTFGTEDLSIWRHAANVARIGGDNTGAVAGKLFVSRSDKTHVGWFTVDGDTANTNAVADVGAIGLDSTGTAAAGLGAQLQLTLESSSTNQQQAAGMTWVWTTATHASRTADLYFSTVNNASVSESFRIVGGGAFRSASIADPGSPTNGDVWNSSARNCYSVRQSGQTEDFSTTMWRSSGQSSFDTTSSATSVIADTGVGTKTVAADRLKVGNQIRITAGGVYGTKASSAGTFTLRVRTGGVTMLTSVFTLPDGVTDQVWSLEAVGALNTTGSSGVIYWRLTWLMTDSSGIAYMTNYTVNSTTINTTTSRALDVTGQFSVSDADNFFQTDVATIEMLS